MGVQKLLFHKTQFIFLFRKMIFFIRVLWVSFFTLFGFIRQCLFRFQKKKSNYMMIQSQEDEQNSGSLIEVEKSVDISEKGEGESEIFLRFRFPTYEEFLQNNSRNENLDKFSSVVETKDDFLGSEINNVKISDKFSHVEEIVEHENSSETEGKNNEYYLDKCVHVRNVVEHGDVLPKGDTNEISSNVGVSQQENSGETKVGMNDFRYNGDKFSSDEMSLVNDSKNSEGVMRTNNHFPSEDDSLVSDSDSDSMAPSSESSFRSSFIDSLSDGFLSDIDFERAFEVDSSTEFGWNEVTLTKEALAEEDLEFLNLSKGYEADDCDDDDEDILEELRNLESSLESGDDDPNKEHGAKMDSEAENKQNEGKSSSGEQLSSDSDEQNRLEAQWEHQHIIEQLKMEIKKVRAIGLPTILEESESPKIMDDLKPWKIDEKYQRRGNKDELHKFYKSYKERMRRLDIVNYQKMYAIGFLRLKDPLQSLTKHKVSTPGLATIVALDCWPCKPKSLPEIHQPVMKKFSKELESDLEMVYVGQMCLSWELLRWQYGKALEIWDTDPHGVHRYNEVADKFQTFQVLLTRFLEDECFKGPRVQNYVMNRCVHRNLLQVPLIRDDNMKDRKKEDNVISSKDAITSLQLVEIIEESIRILWRFIKTDKDTNNIILLKCRRDTKVELQNPADASLLEEIRSRLHKKQKKLKELSRTEKCILRKIQKHQQEEGADNVLYFFSRVDLRLVSRVLNMPRITTEQLVWCNDKLNNILLVGSKLHVEPSVLLFPCS